jgi:hypothetical protein
MRPHGWALQFARIDQMNLQIHRVGWFLILYSIETGLPARAKLFGMEACEYLKTDPETARLFDDAMTGMSVLVGPVVAGAYDFGKWGSLMDVGGGNGILLAAILRVHPGLCGTLP